MKCGPSPQALCTAGSVQVVYGEGTLVQASLTAVRVSQWQLAHRKYDTFQQVVYTFKSINVFVGDTELPICS